MSAVPYKVSVDQYKQYRSDGFLVVRDLVSRDDVERLLVHSEALMSGEIEVPGVAAPEPNATREELERRLLRIHMLHEKLPIWEEYLLHTRVLDVAQALAGPDLLALQTMMFIKGPGALGQGFHQDTYYIPTFPDTLIGAWIALDPADEENGCLRMAKGSSIEPVYPPPHLHSFGERWLAGITEVENVGGHCNDDDDPTNTLKPLAVPYEEVPVVLNPGDVAFFNGHVLHRSLSNRTTDRFRRSFVNHYCNARSFTHWGGGNGAHILARGGTHLAYARPRFGTPCAANRPESSPVDQNCEASMMMGMPDGMESRRVEEEEHTH